MKRGSRVTAWVGGFVAALIVVLVLFVWLFNWNRARPFINDKVSQAIGRPFAINGDLTVAWKRDTGDGFWASLVPWPQFTARDISLANPGWAEKPQFATLKALRFRLSPLALLGHRVSVPALQLVQPSIDLERNAKSQATWDVAPRTSDGKPSSWTLDLGRIGFDRGTISLIDAPQDATAKITITPLEKSIPYADLVASTSSSVRRELGQSNGNGARKALAASGAKSSKAVADNGGNGTLYQFSWKATGSYHGAPIEGSGKTGGVLALRSSSQPFPVQAHVHIGDTHIALVGTLTDPVHLGALDLKLWLSGSSMARLYPLTGVTLPDTPPYATEGHLQAQLHGAHKRFSYKDFHGRVGQSDLSGDLMFVTGAPRPRLTGELHSKLLQFSDLAPLIGARSDDSKAPPEHPPQPPGKLLPVQPFRTDRWQAMDADVTFSSDRIAHGKALPIDGLKTHLVMNDGDLKLDPLTFDLAGGTLKSTIHLDGSKQPMQGSMSLDARHLKLRQLLPEVKSMQSALGELNADASLKAHGNSVAALLGSSNGEVKLLMNDGVISRFLMEAAGLNVANAVYQKLFGHDTVKINCAAVDLTGTHGLYRSRLFVLDTGDAVIKVGGTINLASEKLDLTINPETRGFRIFSLRSPLYVQGTFKNPSVGVKAGPLALRAGAAVVLGAIAAPAAGLLALISPDRDGPKNTCEAVLGELRDTGRIEAPPPTKKVKDKGGKK